ncbi:MAG: GNAT family N-acetyltransferase [Myxococcales bacterium]
MITLHTERLVLRPWRESDLEPFARLNADPEVMRYLPGQLSREESETLMQRLQDHIRAHGYGLWALEERDGAPLVGFVGIVHAVFEAHFTPCIEVGWRLARHAWGKGYATEAARESLRFAFDALSQQEVLAYTVPPNLASRRVMDRIGMTHDASGDFDHPRLPPGHPLRPHVLYRLPKAAWKAPLK